MSLFIRPSGALPCTNTITEGFKQAKAVEEDLEQAVGLRPSVGFNWNNGRLLSVTVIFPYLYDTKPMRELAEAVRAAVGKEFKQTPEDIVLGFSLSRPAPGRAAQAGQTH